MAVTSYTTIEGTIKRETVAALLLITSNLEGEEVEEWFPFSQIKSISRSQSAEQDKITVADWILRKKGILK